MQWSFAKRIASLNISIIREILKLLEKGEVISFAGGIPAAELFPLAQLRAVTDKVMREEGKEALQYSITEGYPPLRRFLAERLRRKGIKAGIDNILITNGSQQALDLIGKIFLDPGDWIITEQPTYLGALQAFGFYQAEFCGLAIDDEGMRVELLARAIERVNPRLIYVLPNFQNPAGVTLSLRRRSQLAQLALARGIPLVEDDPYGELRYRGEHLPPLKALADENTILLGTISKIITPGHRLGWVVAPEAVIKKLVMAKQAADLHTNSFSQRVIYRYCEQGYLDEYIATLCSHYSRKMQAMLEAMQSYFPPEVEWTRPEGGLFLWVSLPAGLSSSEILPAAIDRGVAFVPGVAFSPDRRSDNSMRLSFSSASFAQIDTGIKKLGQVLKDWLAKTHSANTT